MDCSTSKPQTVFKSGEKVYRIPALFYERESQTFLAFAEERKDIEDVDAEKLVMKTGKLDSSKTIIEWSEETKTVDKAQTKDHRTMNPCPLYEKSSKTLFLFFICVKDNVSELDQLKTRENKTRLCFITSTDVGQTWKDLIDLTEKLNVIQRWDTFAVGPGHGIQTESGRLVVPVHGYTYDSKRPYSPDGLFSHTLNALYLYRDDKDKEWKFSEKIENQSGECQMAEVTDDKGSFIYCNARSAEDCRVEAVSSDDEAGFTALQAEKLVETEGKKKIKGCHGSVVSFPAQSDGDQSVNKWLLYSHPSSQSERVDLGVYLNRSPRDPSAWSKPWIINSGPSGYSDLVYAGDGLFACLMERGKDKETEITSAVFSYTEVKQGIGDEKKNLCF